MVNPLLGIPGVVPVRLLIEGTALTLFAAMWTLANHPLRRKTILPPRLCS